MERIVERPGALDVHKGERDGVRSHLEGTRA